MQETVSRFYIFRQGMEKQKPIGFLAGCKTCRHKPGGVPAFVAVAHDLGVLYFIRLA